MDLESRATVIFEHLPKTAGSTMYDILLRQYRGVAQFRGASLERDRWRVHDTFCELTEGTRNSFGLIYGHGVLAFDPLVRSPKKYITFLRDPYQQLVSGFFYIKRASWNQHHQAVARLATVGDYLEYTVDKGFDNMQTRYMSGDPQVIGPREERTGYAVVDAPIYDRAITNLERFSVVGLTEEFDASILLMADALGWRRHLNYRVLNRTQGRPDPVPDARLAERFAQVYKWDIALYRAAEERFTDAVSNAGPGFSVRLRNFRRVNSAYQFLGRLLRR